jgi:itaconyl-CoA hydratase
VVEKRESKSRPDQGVVSVRTTGKNQDGVVVCTFQRTMLIWKRGRGPMES